MGVRPQGLALGTEGVPAEVEVVEELGSETFVFVELEHLGETTRIRVRVDAEYQVSRGDNTHVEVLGPVHVFGADGTPPQDLDRTGGLITDAGWRMTSPARPPW